MRVIPHLAATGLLLAATVASAGPSSEAMPPFPNLELHSLANGSVTQLESLQGHPVLLTFWASWCGPCRMELPEIQKLYTSFGDDGFVVAAVNMDRSPEIARVFVQQVGIDLPVYRIDPRVVRELGVTSLPTNVLLDASGRVVQIYEGYDPAVVKDIRRRLEGMLATPASPPAGPGKTSHGASVTANG